MTTHIAGIAFGLLFVINSTLINLCVKFINASTFAIMFARYHLAFFILLPFICYLWKNKCSVKLHFVRAVFVFLLNFLTYYGQKNAAFVNVNLIAMSEPLFVFLYSALINKEQVQFWLKQIIAKFEAKRRIPPEHFEKINHIIHQTQPLSKRQGFLLIIGYLGVTLVILAKNADTVTNTLSGNAASLLANVLAAGMIFVTRYMAVIENVKTLLIYNAFFLWIFSWLLTPHAISLITLSRFELALIVTVGFLATSLYFLNMSSLKRLKPELYSPLLYTRIIFATTIAYFILGEALSVMHFIGYACIIFALVKLNQYKITKDNS